MKITAMATQLRVADLERALRFYTETLGFELDFRFQDFYAGLRAGEARVHLKAFETKDPSIAFVREGDHLHLYFNVDDLEASFSELEAKGVEVVYAIEQKPWGDYEFTIRDPDGHTLYFSGPVGLRRPT